MCGEQRSDYPSSQASGINTIRTQSTLGKVHARVFIVSISLHRFFCNLSNLKMVRDTILDLGEKNGLWVTFVALLRYMGEFNLIRTTLKSNYRHYFRRNLKIT